MIEALQGWIKACQENIVYYKQIGDEKAVEAAEGMIRDMEKLLEMEMA